MLLDFIIVVIYVSCMLLLGYIGFKRAKNNEDYLVAGRNLGAGFYMATMAATVLGGASTVGTVKLGYSYGISGVWLCASLGIGIIIINLVLAKPLLKLRIFTVTQVLEKRYNSTVRKASAVVMLAYASMIAVTSVIAMCNILEPLFTLHHWLAVLIGGGVVVIYSAIGGMWSLTLTDIVQFFIKTIGIIFILLPICLYQAGGWDALAERLPASRFDITNIGVSTIISYFLIYFFGILMGQDIWQRVFTARSAQVAKYAGTAAGLYCVLYGLICAIIGMCASIIIPNLADANNAFGHLLELVLPMGIRGLIIAATLAAMMSTASAALLASSTVFTEDLLPSLTHRKTNIRLNRIATFCFGALILVISMLVNDVINALTLAYNLLVGGMLIPLIGAIYWKRATTFGAMLSMVVGLVTVIIFIIKDGLGANSAIYYSLSIGLFSFIIASCLTKTTTPAIFQQQTMSAEKKIA